MFGISFGCSIALTEIAALLNSNGTNGIKSYFSTVSSAFIFSEFFNSLSIVCVRLVCPTEKKNSKHDSVGARAIRQRMETRA